MRAGATGTGVVAEGSATWGEVVGATVAGGHEQKQCVQAGARAKLLALQERGVPWGEAVGQEQQGKQMVEQYWGLGAGAAGVGAKAAEQGQE